MNDKYIWAHIEFFVCPTVNIDRIEGIAIRVAKKSIYFSEVEEPSFWVMEMEKDSCKCWLAAWAETPSDAWELRHNMRSELIKEFVKEGIQFHKFNLSSGNSTVLQPEKLI